MGKKLLFFVLIGIGCYTSTRAMEQGHNGQKPLTFYSEELILIHMQNFIKTLIHINLDPETFASLHCTLSTVAFFAKSSLDSEELALIDSVLGRLQITLGTLQHTYHNNNDLCTAFFNASRKTDALRKTVNATKKISVDALVTLIADITKIFIISQKTYVET